MKQPPSMSPESEPLLTPAEVGRQLRVSINTVHRLADRGDIASYKVGRLRRFTTAALDDYLKRCAQGTDHQQTISAVSA